MSAPNKIKKGRSLRALHRIGSNTGRSKATFHFTAWLFAIAALVLIFAMSQFAVAKNHAATRTIVAGTVPQCVSPPRGLMHWWKGDGDAFDTEGLNNGVLVNGASFAPGKVRQAFSLKGAQHQSVATSGTLDLGVVWSIDVWIKPTDLASSPVIFGNYDGTNGYFVDIFSGGQVRGFTRAGANQTFYATPPVITVGTWQHVAVTYDGNAGPGTKFHFYVNGAAVAANVTADAGGAPGASSVNARIGADPASPNQKNFNGLIDEVEIDNVALSRHEVAGIVKADSSGKCAPEVYVPAAAPIPGGVGNFTVLHAPSFSGSATAFLGQGTGGQNGSYFQPLGGSLIKVADRNTAIPNGTGNFVSFSPGAPSVSGDNVVTYGTGMNGQQGVFLFNTQTLGNPCRIADTNTPIPGG